MPQYKHFLLLGADSDVACRYVFPALSELEAAQLLPPNFRIVGVTRKDWKADRDFRRHIETQVKKRWKNTKIGMLKRVLARVTHDRADLTDSHQCERVIGSIQDSAVLYLGLPPSVTEAIVGHLGEVTLPRQSRLMMEKPFAHDLASAKELNRRLHELLSGTRHFSRRSFLG